MIYKSGKEKDINISRYKRFHKKVSCISSFVHPSTLPPTSVTAKYHSYRVFYHVQQWIGGREISPTDWGWYLKDLKLYPIETDILPTPSILLKMIRCNCKMDCSKFKCS